MTRRSYEGVPENPEFSQQGLRGLAKAVKGLLLGKSNNVADLTLTGSSATTTISDRRIGPDSQIGFMPTTANAQRALIGKSGLLGRQVITTTGAGTYTPTTGTDFVIIEMQAGGGGGGACAGSPGAGLVGIGQSGSGGGYISVMLTADFSGAAYSVGAKGGGGSSGGNNAGTAGGNTTFTTTAPSSTTYTATGGSPGSTPGAFAPPFLTNNVTCSASTNGDYRETGGPSAAGFAQATNGAMSGNGGAAKFSRGAAGIGIFAVNGTSAGLAPVVGENYGGGGSGAVVGGTGATKAGGDGAPGILIIWEYTYGTGGLYVSSRGQYTATVTHASNSQSDRSFVLDITG